jgi:D-galactarolactone cycloisomerase
MKIISVEAIPVRLPRSREQAVGTAGSPTPLRERHGDYRWSDTVRALYSIHFETALVKVTTDTGLAGWGEAQAPLAPEVACEIVRLLLTPVLVGAEFDGSAEAIGYLWQQMYQSMRVRGQTGGFMLDAISGVDIALWDLAGQAQKRPIAEIISGRAVASVPAYFSGLPGSTVDQCVENATQEAARGFRVFKLFHDRDERDLLARIDALSNSLSADVRFAVDALWRLGPASAVGFGLELDRRHALWLEAPFPPEDIGAHRELARAIRTPIALGESYRTWFEISPFLRERAVGFVQPDLGRCGITEFLRISKAARSAGADVVPHVSIALGPQIAAAIHAAAAIGCRWLEYNPNVLGIANAYLRHPLEIARAEYCVPRGPGLGIGLEEESLRRDLLTLHI